MKSNTDFLTDLSHGLRTPLSSLLATIEALASTPLEPSQREMLDDMTLAGEQLNRLLSEMLDPATIEAGKINADPAGLSSTEPSEKSAESSREELRITLSGLKILVAEDVLLNRRSLKNLLAGIDVELKFAIDGTEALKLLKSMVFDVAIIDLRMPHKDGFGVMKELRKFEVEQSRQRVGAIACSANIPPKVWSECEEVGFQTFLKKPFSLNELHDSISRVLGR